MVLRNLNFLTPELLYYFYTLTWVLSRTDQLEFRKGRPVKWNDESAEN